MHLPLVRELEIGARRLAAQQRTAEAVSLALEQGLDDLAAELLASGSADLVRTAGDHEVFFQVVERLGAERLRRWPQLDAAAIWVLTMNNRLRLASVRLDELEARIPELSAAGRSFVVELQRTPFDRIDPATAMPCWVGLMRSLIAAFAGEADNALRLAAQWRGAFPRAPEYELATLCCASMLGYQLSGRWAEAERDGRRALGIFRDERIEYGLAWSATGVGFTLFKQGRIAEAQLLLEDAMRRVASGVGRPTHADVPLRLAECFVLFERGEFAALLSRAGTPLHEYPSPMLALGRVRVAVWTLLALGRPADALAMLETAHFEGSTDARQWWDREFAIERARTALVAGETDRRWYAGPASERELLDLLAASRRNPSPALLRTLRPWLSRAEEDRDACRFALLLFVKARIEHDIGQGLQARRSLGRLLTDALTRQRIGTLASLAPGLQPLFNEVLAGLLRDGANPDPNLTRLAALLGQPVGAGPLPAAPFALSKRERQVAAALLEGLSNRDIAARLHLTEQTVKWHLWNLFQKLGVRNRTGAARLLSQHGFE
ncbi:LuxR C-terminal-related transcriptional regulator [Hydrocarboniphaga sp.]|uniref:helix-turn-helix transcriptional regulator n=1 Tax=Hydrocarboniphaga sp. TaxID=2033016 RepID=UPI00261E2A1A|nr:LuxR C-terminal-related transcriptional regulator [Hydrocarboniphaga sp.]